MGPLNREGQEQGQAGRGRRGRHRSQGDRGEEGAGRVRLGGEEAKGGGNGDRGSKSTLDTLEEAATHRSDPLSVLVRIPPRTPSAEEAAVVF